MTKKKKKTYKQGRKKKTYRQAYHKGRNKIKGDVLKELDKTIKQLKTLLDKLKKGKKL